MLAEDTFNIAFCSDNAFAQHAAVTIRSLIDNASDPKALHLWLLDVGISSESRARIAGMCARLGVSIDFLNSRFSEDETLLADRHVSRATYGRLFLSELLDASIKTCLYLDLDLIVLDDILKLSTIDFKDKWIASVDDFYLSRNTALRMPASAHYFNAGVLLMNLVQWRKEKIAAMVLDYAGKNPEKLLYWDQDAMNAVLYDKRFSLPLRWNQQRHFEDHLVCLPGGGGEKEMSDAMIDPAIVHFIGPEKPWHYLCVHPHRELYYTYLEKTPWKGFSIPKPESVADFFCDRRIVIFGAGRSGAQAIALYRKYGCNPEYVLDNDPLKAGCTHEGLPIYAPIHLAKEDHENLVIVIASMYRNEIAGQLTAMGLKENIHFVKRGFEHCLLKLQQVSAE